MKQMRRTSKQPMVNTPARRPFPAECSRPKMMVERLEQRRLLASIAGNVWFDMDQNRLRDFHESPIEGILVYLDLNQNGQFDDGEPHTFTNANGNYRFDDLEPGEYYVGVRMLFEEEGETIRYAQTSPGIGGASNAAGNYNIEIVYGDNNLSPELRTGVETAIGRWEQVIWGDTPGDPTRDIDDLRVTVLAQNLGPSGPLAFARTTATTNFPGGLPFPVPNNPGLPTQGEVTLNLFYSALNREFFETVVHEVGHVLGIGQLWDVFIVGSPASPFYIGEAGLMEYNRILGLNATGVPVEPNIRAHWDQNAFFGTEVMVPISIGGSDLPFDGPVVQALSRVTVGALDDLGFDVNYGGVDPWGAPGQPPVGPLPEDFIGEIGFRSFQFGVVLENEGDTYERANFGLRLNERPRPFFFNAGPRVVEPGQPLRFLVEHTIDDDFRDHVVQVNFYRETNGIPGLQTGEGGDELLAEVAIANPDGSWEITVDTTGWELGEQTFYARAYDRGYHVRDRQVTVEFVTDQEIPAKPVDLRGLALDESRILLAWTDRADDETGFLLQVSPDNFQTHANIRNIWLPAHDEEGPATFVYETEEGPLTTRYFRVRAYNTAGSSPFAGREQVRTLSAGEIQVDDADTDRVTFTGDFMQIADPTIARNLTFLRGTSGEITIDPGLMPEQERNYLLFLRNPTLDLPGRITVTVFGADGEADQVIVNQQEGASGEVLLGTFRLGEGSIITITPEEGFARFDYLRLLPTAGTA